MFNFINIPSYLVLLGAISLALYGAESTLSTIWMKKLHFKHLAIRELIAGSISIGIGLFIAHKNGGALALVAQHTVAVATRTAYTLIFTEWKPSIKYYMQAPLTRVPSFGYQFQVTWGILKYADQLLISLLLGVSSLGLYQFGKKIAELPLVNLSNIIGKYLFPKLSIAINEENNMFAAQAIFIRNAKLILWVSIPFCMIGLFWGEMLIEYFLPKHWQPIKEYIGYFFLSSLFMALIPLFGSLLKASKAKEVLNWWGMIYPLSFLIVAAIGAYFFELKGLLIGAIATKIIFFIASLIITEKLFPDLGKRVTIMIIKIFSLSAVMILLIFLLQNTNQ